MAYSTRLQALRETIRKSTPDCIIICERSLEADRNIFAQMLYDDGKIEEINYKIYCHFYDQFSQEFKADGVIYMNADSKICQNRIARRAREGESSISLDYLIKCKFYHDNWLFPKKLETPTYIINANPCVTYENDTGYSWLLAASEFIKNIVDAQTDSESI
jgi:deoxyadenosine/deoxycytidine kinase